MCCSAYCSACQALVEHEIFAGMLDSVLQCVLQSVLQCVLQSVLQSVLQIVLQRVLQCVLQSVSGAPLDERLRRVAKTHRMP